MIKSITNLHVGGWLAPSLENGKEEEEEERMREQEQEGSCIKINQRTYIFVVFVQQCFIGADLRKTNFVLHC